MESSQGDHAEHFSGANLLLEPCIFPYSVMLTSKNALILVLEERQNKQC